MQFRKDINGLRAIAVIAVVLFHFNSSWIPGGFAGVDVFFVISGFLMTGIIFKGLESNNFSTIKFYIARANRIIPALFFLCFSLFIFGWLFLSPTEFSLLGKHIRGSIGFFSNFTYWSESGYFDSSSNEKWLLHTWSLSVEWQFYVLYPVVLVLMKKFLSFNMMKRILLAFTLLGFVFSVVISHLWPSPSYYLLPSRAWELMIGGLAFLYPLSIKEINKKVLEFIGLVFILSSYIFISEESTWPGYLAIFPVLGTVLIILSNRADSLVTGNYISQKIGSWSYSIYLWHWPLVVGIYYFSLTDIYIYPSLLITLILGFVSYKFIENIQFTKTFSSPLSYLKCKPIYMVIFLGGLGTFTFMNNGFIDSVSSEYQKIVKDAVPSPLRDKCHVDRYQEPSLACEYFNTSNVSWAVFGDSHSAEIAYALAKQLELEGVGLKHFTYSACDPAFKEEVGFNKCVEWYNDTVDYIVNSDNIRNVVLNHRFTRAMVGDKYDYPKPFISVITQEVKTTMKHLDELIFLLASVKDEVYIYYPIPELQRNINSLIGSPHKGKSTIQNVLGTDLRWYQDRNKYMINHFDNANYPKNVHLLKPQDKYCDEEYCFAVKDGIPLYFDHTHPSVAGAKKLVELIIDK